jgi:hypothetical protein
VSPGRRPGHWPAAGRPRNSQRNQREPESAPDRGVQLGVALFLFSHGQSLLSCEDKKGRTPPRASPPPAGRWVERPAGRGQPGQDNSLKTFIQRLNGRNLDLHQSKDTINSRCIHGFFPCCDPSAPRASPGRGPGQLVRKTPRARCSGRAPDDPSALVSVRHCAYPCAVARFGSVFWPGRWRLLAGFLLRSAARTRQHLCNNTS